MGSRNLLISIFLQSSDCYNNNNLQCSGANWSQPFGADQSLQSASF
jgi:hypothetical protein